VPPALATPFSPSWGAESAGSGFDINVNWNSRLIEIEYVEERIVVEDVDGWVAV